MLRLSGTWLNLASAGIAVIGSSCPARAQVASGGDTTLFRSDAAGVRVEPGFEASPLTLGPLVADIKLATQTAYQSNVRRTEAGAVGDVVFALTPSLRISSQFGSHTAAVSARANIRRYARLASENAETLDLTFSGRIDLGHQSHATFRTQYARDVEPRGSSGVNMLTAGLSRFQLLQSSYAVGTEFGPLGVSAAGGVVERTYLPLDRTAGGVIDQSFRDTRTFLVAPRISYSVASVASVFIGGSATANRSLNRAADARRDSNGYAILGGVRSDSRELIVGEIGVGWRGQTYRNPAFIDYRGLTYDATVDWYPTRLVSLRLAAGQDIVNSGVAQVAGIVRRNLGLTAYYDPLRRLRLSVELGQEHDRYREIGLTTDTNTLVLTGRYLVNRHLTASAFGRYDTRNSSRQASLTGFSGFAIGFGLTGGL